MKIFGNIKRLLRNRFQRRTSGRTSESIDGIFTNFDRPVQHCIVDNRVFLLGLDGLYRTAMKRHERGELLVSARRVAQALRIAPARVTIEGYYTEDKQLRHYFRLMRALQNESDEREQEVSALSEFTRLYEVTSAPLFGHPERDGKLLPKGRDPLTDALMATWPPWTVPRVLDTAEEIARRGDDISLVGMAALARDPVVLTALRESVVLYAAGVLTSAGLPPRREFVWQVDDDLAERATRFISVFQTLFGDELPAPIPEHGEQYWNAYKDNDILGRCVRLGSTPEETEHYHWAICRTDGGETTVQEFWHPEVWTTERYRNGLNRFGCRPDLQKRP